MDFFHAHISPKAIELATETLRSGFISEGKRVRQFEDELARVFGLCRPVAVNSGTSALHLALAVAGIGPGDEVILPPQTFVASAHAILLCGGKPVFADISPATGNIDPVSIRAKITSQTRAIMPVHWGGLPCDMDEINAVARERNLVVVEDAAQALGATYKGQPVGNLSRLTAFSFQAIKPLTTVDGGAVCCLNEDDERQARQRRWFGIDREHDRPSILGERVYNLDKVGFKYHLNDVAAAIGLGNLPDIPGNLARHRQIAEIYRERLRDVPGLTHLDYGSDRESAWWVFTVLVERREDFIRALQARGIPSGVVHQGIDRNRVFGGRQDGLTGQRRFDDLQVALPVHCNLSDDDVERVVEAVKGGW